MQGGILILDFGSQYTQLIARRLRELNIYSRIEPFSYSIDEIKKIKPHGIILSGGPNSVFDSESPKADVRSLMDVAPLMGVCYGMQLVAHGLGGIVEPGKKREYGRTVITWPEEDDRKQKVWMSHGDVVTVPPPGFSIVAQSESGLMAAMKSSRVVTYQFHPEVSHTENGDLILKSFVEEMCSVPRDWAAPDIVKHIEEDIVKKVPTGESVLCALSGGVDSTVTAVLLTRALGPDRVHCVFVDHGLLRKNEYEDVMKIYKKLNLSVFAHKAESVFLSRLADIAEPEQKRKIIGNVFVEEFDKFAKKFKDIKWLAQGTLYPDVIESVAVRGVSHKIKTHHNVGGLPEKMKLKLIEPLRELFKDEVRRIGEELGIAHEFLYRHPFPGPGLAVRILGAVDRESIQILQECDHIFIDELKKNDLYQKIWQAFAVLTPIQTVGVQGDFRTYDRVVGLRAVTSEDGMTADWFAFPPDVLRKISSRITNEVKGVNRVVYDITSKPPGTIEWE